jgi:hypothetical protein
MGRRARRCAAWCWRRLPKVVEAAAPFLTSTDSLTRAHSAAASRAITSQVQKARARSSRLCLDCSLRTTALPYTAVSATDLWAKRRPKRASQLLVGLDSVKAGQRSAGEGAATPRPAPAAPPRYEQPAVAAPRHLVGRQLLAAAQPLAQRADEAVALLHQHRQRRELLVHAHAQVLHLPGAIDHAAAASLHAQREARVDEPRVRYGCAGGLLGPESRFVPLQSRAPLLHFASRASPD